MKKNAFTMIELIFVIVILGILAAVAMPKYNGVQLDAKIAFEKNRIGALRSTISAIHAKSIIKNGDFTILTDSPDGNGRNGLLVSVSKYNYPLNVSVKNEKDNDGKYHITFDNQHEATNGINGAVMAVIMTYSSRDQFSTGKTYIEEATPGECDKDSEKCKLLIEGPATKPTGISENEGFYSLNRRGAWVYNSIEGIINYYEEKSDGTALNIGKGDEDGSSPDF